MMVPGARVELAWISPNDFEFWQDFGRRNSLLRYKDWNYRISRCSLAFAESAFEPYGNEKSPFCFAFLLKEWKRRVEMNFHSIFQLFLEALRGNQFRLGSVSENRNLTSYLPTNILPFLTQKIQQ